LRHPWRSRANTLRLTRERTGSPKSKQ
jgi:hypothetical protein